MGDVDPVWATDPDRVQTTIGANHLYKDHSQPITNIAIASSREREAKETDLKRIRNPLCMYVANALLFKNKPNQTNQQRVLT